MQALSRAASSMRFPRAGGVRRRGGSPGRSGGRRRQRIVVMPPQVAEEIYPAARKAEDRSPFTRQWLQKGGDLAEITGQDAAAIEIMLRERGWLD